MMYCTISYHYILTNDIQDVVKVKAATKEENMKKAMEEKEKEALAEKRARRRAFAQKISLTYNPSAALAFVVVYWVVGLKNAQFY